MPGAGGPPFLLHCETVERKHVILNQTTNAESC